MKNMEYVTPSQLTERPRNASHENQEKPDFGIVKSMLMEKLSSDTQKTAEILKSLDEELNQQGLNIKTFCDLFGAASDNDKNTILEKLMTLKQPDFSGNFEDIKIVRKKTKDTVQEIDSILDAVLEKIRSTNNRIH